MTEYERHLDYYSSEEFQASTLADKMVWGNEVAARQYLEKYFLPQAEYERDWRPVQDKIFINQDRGLPEFVFPSGYELIALRGGVVFAQEDFEQLQRCLHTLGEEHFVVIENTFGGKLDSPQLRMKYPVGITWAELISGNFISSFLFGFSAEEYFVFGEIADWGKYAANDYENPLDIVGFKPEHEALFRKEFAVPQAEWAEIATWLPPAYRARVKPPLILPAAAESGA